MNNFISSLLIYLKFSLLVIISLNGCALNVKGVQIWSYFWSVFSYIQSEYRKIRTRNKSAFGHFSHNVLLRGQHNDRSALGLKVDLAWYKMEFQRPGPNRNIFSFSSNCCIEPTKLKKCGNFHQCWMMGTFKNLFFSSLVRSLSDIQF